jgi:hypothetical protein
MLALALCLVVTAMPAAAQTAGEGSLEGTVVDSTGAVVPHAGIIITNNATGIKTVSDASSAGFFNIAPVLPGTYTLEISAKGFKTLVQDNVVVDAMQVRTVAPVLAIGAETQTVTVTAAPPVLDTADATIGMIVENSTYTNLPIQMNGGQRDPTSFGVLTPGAQSANNGGRLPIIGGTGSYLGQLYVDGMPAETVSQQGDNRLVSLAMDIDAVDQFQEVTSTPPAEYAGAGATNFTMKSGGLQYHGQVSDFERNTEFDSWGFTAPHATEKTVTGATIPAPKPVEHQHEWSGTFGGVVPFTHKKLFFFVAYDYFYDRKGATYSLLTVPSNLMTQGNFTELGCLTAGTPCNGSGITGTNSATNAPVIFDPTSTTCAAGVCTRTPFQYNGTYNVIPPGDISSITKGMESLFPTSNSSNIYYSDWNSSVLTNNYLSGWPGGYNNHVIDWRVDYDLNSKQRISSVGTMGTEDYLNNYGSPFLPPPYIGGDLASIFPKNYIVEDAYTITPNLVNQLKYSFTRFYQNIHDATQGNTPWEVGTFGVTNLPAGQAGQEFPGVAFGSVSTAFGGLAEQTWTGNGNSISTQLTTPNNYAVTDNVQWLKGKHALTMGLTFQWQEINNANPATFTGVLDFGFNPYSTSQFTTKAGSTTALSDANTGFSYASFLLGAAGGSTSTDGTNQTLGLDYVSELAGRYKTISPYVRDSYKITSKLTLDIGVRWDYLPPFHELRNRWTFLNPTMTNPLTNTPGILQFAGNYGGAGVSCGCTTPVSTYWKNWGPRFGAAYSLNSKTVVRAGFALAFSQAGGVGGRGGAYNGTGQTGFNTTAVGPSGAVTGGYAAGPAFWLNSNTAYVQSNANESYVANTGLFGPGFTYPAQPSFNVTAQEIGTGFISTGGGSGKANAGASYADPYLSGRAPEIVLWNFGFERAITPSMTAAINYVGDESHFIVNSGTTGGNARGLWTNELSPYYMALLGPVVGDSGLPLLASQADATNLKTLASYAPNAPQPAFYTNNGAGSNSSTATIQQMLVAFPQYSGVTDTWGNVGNFAYNALQFMIQQRPAHGLTFTMNYTYSKNLGDDGTYRSGWALPANAISRSTNGATLPQNRIDRSLTVISIPQTVNIFGVYQLPFGGKGQPGGDHAAVRWLAGGWQFSEIYTYLAGTPVVVNGGSGAAGQGQAMPDLNPGWTSTTARQNGSYGSGPNGFQYANLSNIKYVNSAAFISAVDNSTAPGCVPGSSSQAQGSCQASYLIGNAPRTAAYGLRNPGAQNLNAGLRRSFPLGNESRTFVFEANCFNVWNKVQFGGPSASWSYNSSSFGEITGVSNSARDWQFAGHINF